VIAELKRLRNVRYGNRPVSLYGGMVDLPLIVIRPDGTRFFDDEERDRLTDGQLWAEFDAERDAGVAAMERELRENLLGNSAWSVLELTTRTFLATAEDIFRTHRGDAAFDFASVLGSFAKALEVECNAILRRALAGAKPAARRAKVGDRTVDLAAFRSLTLGELAYTLGSERELATVVAGTVESGRWFANELPVVLDAFVQVRNPGTHSARLDLATASEWRNRLMGIGCLGIFVELARVHLKAK